MQFNFNPELMPLTIAAADEFSAWARSRALTAVREQLRVYAECGVYLEDQEKRRIIDAAYAKIDAGLHYIEALRSTEGLTRLVWLCLRDRNGITLDQVGRLLPFSDRARIRRSVMALLDGTPTADAPPDSTSAPEKPTPPPRIDPVARREAIFREMCRRAGMTPAQLVRHPISDAAKLYCKILNIPEVSEQRLKKYLIDFAEANGGFATDEQTGVVETFETSLDGKRMIHTINGAEVDGGR